MGWLGLALAFLLGSIPFGLILVRWEGAGVGDLRRRGSGNVGAANVLRVVGLRAGLLTLVGDVAKGMAAVGLLRALLGGGQGAEQWALLGGAAAVAGHVFSPFLGFRGGKGVATSFGAFLLLTPAAMGVAALAFALLVGLSRRVSVGALGAAAALPPATFLLGYPGLWVGTTLAVGALVAIRHRDNIERLLAGTEPKLGERAG
ncbi:MAG: glycerol-3-phosphate 1-O-acyltransferase PlsY [Nitrospinota bacterium]